jgi:hypothetical protein
MRYLPPLRTYLVLSVLFFLIATIRTPGGEVIQIVQADNGRTSLRVTPLAATDLKGKPGETPEQAAERVCHAAYTGPWHESINRFSDKSCRTLMADQGRSVGEAFLHNLPRALFLMLPVLALLMKLMYRHPRRYYIEHLLFFLHNEAFAFLVFGVYLLVSHFAPRPLTVVLSAGLWLYVPYYQFRSMRVVYGQTRTRTFAKLAVLALAFVTCSILALVLTSVYSVMTV